MKSARRVYTAAGASDQQVQVLDPNGEVVLTTGQRYELALNASVENDFGFPTPMTDLEWTAGCMPVAVLPWTDL